MRWEWSRWMRGWSSHQVYSLGVRQRPRSSTRARSSGKAIMSPITRGHWILSWCSKHLWTERKGSLVSSSSKARVSEILNLISQNLILISRPRILLNWKWINWARTCETFEIMVRPKSILALWLHELNQWSNMSSIRMECKRKNLRRTTSGWPWLPRSERSSTRSWIPNPWILASWIISKSKPDSRRHGLNRIQIGFRLTQLKAPSRSGSNSSVAGITSPMLWAPWRLTVYIRCKTVHFNPSLSKSRRLQCLKRFRSTMEGTLWSSKAHNN